MNLQRFLLDLILIVEFKRPNWYPATVPVDREFGTLFSNHFLGLASINTFIKNMGRFFLKSMDTILR